MATRSPHKIREIREILAEVPGLELVSLADLGIAPSPAEDGLEPHLTFEENARSKARYFWARTGLPVVADDSGLEVDALRGAPGVHTKRFAPVPEGTPDDARDLANNEHLLALLHGRTEAERGARYVCVVALEEERAGGVTLRGEARGRIAVAARGREGFGYDPIFLDLELGRTFAELGPAEKNARSHRGAAFRALAELLDRRVREG